MPLAYPSDALKRAAAEAAVDEVAEGMIIGLGTGTTAAFAIAALGRRVAEGLVIRAAATSLRTAAAAEAVGIPIIDFTTIDRIDLAIDGVDEIDPACRAIKGAGGAMLREKIVATAAARMLAIADGSKLVARIGARPVPVEVLPFALAFVQRRIADLGGQAVVRQDGEANWLSDQGNPVVDAHFATIDDPPALAAALSAIPGALGHGLFLSEIGTLYVGTPAGVVRHDRPR